MKVVFEHIDGHHITVPYAKSIADIMQHSLPVGSKCDYKDGTQVTVIQNG